MNTFDKLVVLGIVVFVTFIALTVTGVLYVLTTTHWVIAVIGLLMLTNKYTRKVLVIAALITVALHLITK